MDDQPTTAPAKMATSELIEQLSAITERTRRFLDEYDSAAAAVLLAAEPAEPGGTRRHHDEYTAVVRAARQRRDHTLEMLTQLTDAIADVAEAACRADEAAAWDCYRRAVAPAEPVAL